jgi:hypothetical protein
MLNQKRIMQKKSGEDPLLCTQCRKFGYCVEKAKQRFWESLSGRLTTNTHPASDKEISNWVPLRPYYKKDPGFQRKLQEAHDLFHQDEFEQAAYLYRDMLVGRNDSDEVHIGLAASLYFMQNYHEAADIAIKLTGVFSNDKATRFILQCIEKIKNVKPVTIENYNKQESSGSEMFSKDKELQGALNNCSAPH